MKNRTKKRNNHPLKWVAAAFTMLFLFPVTTAVYCADPGKPDTGTYRYNPEGKPDPFKPFIHMVERGKSTGEAPDAQVIGEQTAFLPPLQKFSTEEFRLTGIVLTKTKRFAMVETPEGKRYILRRGTHIGINSGKVIKILSDSVVVVEKIKDFEGNIKTERTILTLRKNGGNP